MGAHGQEDWFDEVMPGLDAVRPGGKRRFPWPGRHGKDDGDEAEARTRPRIGVRVGVATVIVTGLMVGAGLTAGMVSANRRERLADASAACERSARTWSAGSAEWGRDRDRIMGSVDLDALRATDPDMADTLERLSSDPVTPAGCTAGGGEAGDGDGPRQVTVGDRTLCEDTPVESNTDDWNGRRSLLGETGSAILPVGVGALLMAGIGAAVVMVRRRKSAHDDTDAALMPRHAA